MTDVVEALLANGAPIDDANVDGDTALHVLCQVGYSFSSLEPYLRKINLFQKDNYKKTALDLALESPLWQSEPQKMQKFFSDLLTYIGGVGLADAAMKFMPNTFLLAFYKAS